MVATIANAAAAYGRAAQGAKGPGLEAEGPAFADVLKEAVGHAVGVQAGSEQISAAAVAGKADMTDVVTAVTNAEVTLQTVTTVRDKVLQAYQEILRMPL
ncbi:MAG TPA: flagellar hook-basal body complex protein FliE [Alphaproteobacteria bacterium]|nr:flagellar hook-basal body complex protein FliE [Alphaproteobacteria bacterium]